MANFGVRKSFIIFYNSARSFRYMDHERGICRTGNGAFTFRSLAWTLDLHHCIAIEQTFCPSHLAAVHHSFCHLVLDRRTASLTHPCLPASNLDRLVVRVHPWFLPPIHICNTEHSYFPNHRRPESGEGYIPCTLLPAPPARCYSMALPLPGTAGPRSAMCGHDE